MTEGRKRFEFSVDCGAAGLRLDRLLRRLLPRVPLSALNRMLRKGAVRIDGARAKGSARPAEGALISLRVGPRDAAEIDSAPAGAAGARGERAVPVDVLFEDDDVIAFDKPAGIAVQPGSGHPLPRTVLGALRERAASTAVFRPALVGRLDRDASGVQLGGKSPAGLRGLEAASRAGRIEKSYVVLARGADLPERGVIDSPLLDRRRGRRRMEVLEAGREGLPEGHVTAVTRFRVLASSGGAALLGVSLGTGRRHQIRAHLASRGWAVAGDVRYGSPGWNRELSESAGVDRLFLHCASASFEHPVTGARLKIGSALPPELARALEALRIGPPPALP